MTAMFLRLAFPSSTPSFDWNNSATWEGVLDNISSVYISYYPDLAFPGATKAVSQFCKLAVKKGVEATGIVIGQGERRKRNNVKKW